VILTLECISEVDGFTVGNKYKMISCSGKYVEMIDDRKERVVLFDIYFSGVTKRLKNK